VHSAQAPLNFLRNPPLRDATARGGASAIRRAPPLISLAARSSNSSPALTDHEVRACWTRSLRFGPPGRSRARRCAPRYRNVSPSDLARPCVQTTPARPRCRVSCTRRESPARSLIAPAGPSNIDRQEAIRRGVHFRRKPETAADRRPRRAHQASSPTLRHQFPRCSVASSPRCLGTAPCLAPIHRHVGCSPVRITARSPGRTRANPRSRRSG